RDNGAINRGLKPLPVTMPLPQRFRGKNISYILSLSNYEIAPAAWTSDDYMSGDIAYAAIDTVLRVIEADTSGTDPYIKVEGYTYHMPYGNLGVHIYGVVGFTLVVLAN